MKNVIIINIISAAFVIIASQPANQFYTGNSNFESHTLCREDSLKWMIYTLNHTFTGSHYRYDSLPGVPLISCDVRIRDIDTTIQDTVVYYFSFYRGDPNIHYLPKRTFYSGLGYSKVAKQYFAIPSVGFPIEIGDNAWANMVKKSEEQFIQFIQSYNGELSNWLKAELIKRRILEE
jgi:hypothetical protein